MAKPRTFSVCQGCGAWKETGRDPWTFFRDYDMRFFLEQHLARCPVTGQPAKIVAVHEDDPDFQPLPPEKEWRPEDCPGYRPLQRPTYSRYKTEIQQRLVGIWTTFEFGSMSDDVFVFLPDGSGVLEYWNVVFAGHRLFRWQLDGDEHICFGSPDDRPADHADTTDGAADYFGTNRAYVELLSSTNEYGEENDLLCIYPNGVEDEPRKFMKSPRSVENYRIPEGDVA